MIFLGKLRHFGWFLQDLYRSREMLGLLTLRDFRERYLGSYLGLVWAFVQPAVSILVLWFVFEVGLRAQAVQDAPFILWLVTGLVPWYFINDSVSTATASVIERSFLVKKVAFRVSLLPIVKIGSALIVHLFFLGVIMVMLLVHGRWPGWAVLQSGYYIFAAVFMLLGFSWISSALAVFLRDLGHFIQVVLSLGIWITPIFWQLELVPERYRFLFKLNPAYYIVRGYRDSFIDGIWFWERPGTTIFFWVLAGCLFIGGALIFRRLRPHFADVL